MTVTMIIRTAEGREHGHAEGVALFHSINPAMNCASPPKKMPMDRMAPKVGGRRYAAQHDSGHPEPISPSGAGSAVMSFIMFAEVMVSAVHQLRGI